AEAACPLEGGVFERDGETWRVEGDCPGPSWERIEELTDGRYFGPDCTQVDAPRAKCEEPSRYSLRVFPTRANRLVFFVASTCAPPASVLLINQSDETVRIDAVQTGDFELDSDSPADGDGELFASADVPQDLAPSDSLPITLQFFSQTPGVTGTVDLEVLYSGGCERFAIRTIHSGVDVAGVAHPLGVDVGTASPGTLGEPVDVVFTPYGSFDGTIFSAGGVSNDVFQVVDPIGATTLRSCEPLSLSVRLDAPLETGVYEGELFWEVQTDTLSGVAFLSLIGRVE
ncbi:MAG: hypothetical protein WBG86_11320, partial [Polyangiales bacterium]